MELKIKTKYDCLKSVSRLAMQTPIDHVYVSDDEMTLRWLWIGDMIIKVKVKIKKILRIYLKVSNMNACFIVRLGCSY